MTPLPTPKFLAPLKRNIFPRDRDSDYRAISSDYLAAVTPLRAINQSWLQGNNPFQTPLCTGSVLVRFYWSASRTSAPPVKHINLSSGVKYRHSISTALELTDSTMLYFSNVAISPFWARTSCMWKAPL